MTSNIENTELPILPGQVRDAIVKVLSADGGRELRVSEIHERVEHVLGRSVPASSVRSSLALHVGSLFDRVSRGRYCVASSVDKLDEPVLKFRHARLYAGDCLDWIRKQPDNSIHAVVTDPPYGANEYSKQEQNKLRSGRGGIWRIPPTFDGVRRSPLPRFTIMSEDDLRRIAAFFEEFAIEIERVLVPGGNVIVASNPLVSHVASIGLSRGGLERRGEIIRLVQTLRGGDRPKGAHEEFSEVSVMPRSQWEPWLLYRKAPMGTVAENLRTWKTGGFRRLNEQRPFGDVIRSATASLAERRVAPHPSLKPQKFLRQIVEAALPLGEGIILDPFAGSGSTLAAANAVGYRSIGVERDPEYIEIAKNAIPALSRIRLKSL